MKTRISNGWIRLPWKVVRSPIVLALLIFSLAVWYHEGYWPLTWTEWQYRSLMQRQSQVSRGMNISQQSRRAHGGTDLKSKQDHIARELAELRHDYETFLSDHSSHSRAMISYGAFLDEIGENDDAVEWWARALQLSGNNPVLLNNLANYYGHCGQSMAAIQLYEAAIELRPHEAVYHFNLANTYFLSRAETARFHHWDKETIFAKALEEFKRARDCDASNFDYATSYAETFYAINFVLHNEPWTEARDAWQHCLSMASLTPYQTDYVNVQLVRVNAYLKEPATCVRHLSEIRNPTQRGIAMRILEKTFPNSFANTLQL